MITQRPHAFALPVWPWVYTLSSPSDPVSTSFTQSPSVVVGVHSPSLRSSFPKFHTVTVSSNGCTLSPSPPSRSSFPKFHTVTVSSNRCTLSSSPHSGPVSQSFTQSLSVVMGAHSLPSLLSCFHKFHTATLYSNGCTLSPFPPVQFPQVSHSHRL